ncbi:hypothetical protein ACFV0Y_16500 [Streptomyces sp. NPDC059569]|uniref:hypothetical protein n=1 Tax=Streptomyces sp. NPDC059569 TaxID=3346869 RepID=UPI0036B3156A
MPIRIRRWQVELYQRAIHVTREPDPNCPDCGGMCGGWSGNAQRASWDECHCLDDIRTWRLPIWRRRHEFEPEPF